MPPSTACASVTSFDWNRTGRRISGAGRKITENGKEIGSGAQTPITVDGTIDGDRLTLAFAETRYRAVDRRAIRSVARRKRGAAWPLLQHRRAIVWNCGGAPRSVIVLNGSGKSLLFPAR